MVHLYEKDEAKRSAIASGRLTSLESNLSRIFSEAIEKGRIECVADPASAVALSDLSFVAVGTPSRKDGSVDLSYVLDSCRDIALGIRNTQKYHAVAIRSTVFPGTTSGVVREMLENLSGKRVGRGFGLAAYPEFLRQGSAIQEMLHPDRIVLGEFDNRSGDVIEGFLRELYGNNVPTLRVSPATAEMIKYASNTFLATKIAFMNEIANLCERFEGVDVQQVADGMGYDPRIGRALLDAGLGFGGPCLPKDLRALAKGAARNGVHLRIIEATMLSNELHTSRIIHLARESIGCLDGKRAAVLGLAFRPGTGEMREAPSVRVVRGLLDAGMNVSVYDPAAMQNAVTLFGNKIVYRKDIRDCLRDADCCFILTEWDEFRTIPSSVFIEEMAQPIVIDGRRALDRSRLDPRIDYRAIGLAKSARSKSSTV
jgi:UDPglucose 6-dehydrogenase